MNFTEIMSKSFFSGLGATLAKEAGRSESAPFVYGIFGAFLLLPKFAYDDEDLKKSYWIKQYSPEVLGDAGHATHAAAPSGDDALILEAVERIKRIEENLGIQK